MEKELKVLLKYIQESLEHSWIHELTGLIEVPILFTFKKIDDLRLCIIY